MCKTYGSRDQRSKIQYRYLVIPCKVVAAWDSFKRYFAPRVDGVSSGGESGDSDSETPETPNSKREYFEKSNSLFSGVNNPFSSGPSSSSYNKVSTNVEDSGAAQRLRWGKGSQFPVSIRAINSPWTIPKDIRIDRELIQNDSL